MPSNPPTVADLEAEVVQLCGLSLAEAGVLFLAPGAAPGDDPITPSIRVGLRKGAKDVGLFLSDPLSLADADVARLTPEAVERVLWWGEVSGLEHALLYWHLATRKAGEEPMMPAPMQGGWLLDERRAVRDRVSTLRARLAEPFRDHFDQVAVVVPPRGVTTIDAFCNDGVAPYGFGFGGEGGYW